MRQQRVEELIGYIRGVWDPEESLVTGKPARWLILSARRLDSQRVQARLVTSPPAGLPLLFDQTLLGEGWDSLLERVPTHTSAPVQALAVARDRALKESAP